MINLKNLIIDNKIFYFSIFLLLILAIVPIFSFSKVELFLQLNKYHTPFLDVFFSFITRLGNGAIFIFLIIALIFFKNFKFHFFVSATSCVLLSLTIQFMKRFIFTDSYRPYKLITKNVSIHWVEGINLHSNYSFPSGHSATIFLLITLIVIFSKGISNFYSIPLIIFATIIAYSRLYIGQHFYNDIYVGALIGVLIGTLSYLIYKKFDKN